MSAPSEAELDVLKAFWRRGPMSAAEVQAELVEEMGWASSTTRTVLERMRSKGLVERRSVHGVAVYAPAATKVDVLSGVLQRMRRILEVDGPLPASAFSGSQILTEQEVTELERRLADQDEVER